jgi:hypothetical protein
MLCSTQRKGKLSVFNGDIGRRRAADLSACALIGTVEAVAALGRPGPAPELQGWTIGTEPFPA